MTVTTYEAVIGLEVHVELATATKLFCGCPNEFGAEPNTNVCPVCLGLPGSLPVLNERSWSTRCGSRRRSHFDVPPESIFHRKNYFYPDMPKDYQVSQYDEPICVEGSLEVDGTTIGIERAHMEEDTGQDAARRRRRPHPRRRALARRLQPRRRPADGDREPSGDPSGEQARAYVERAAGDAPRDRRLGREDGRRLDAGRRERVDPSGRARASSAPRSRSRT